MAKLSGSGEEIRRTSFKGNFVIYVRNGVPVLAKWPNKRKGPMSAKQAAAVEKFTHAARATKYMDPKMQEIAREYTKGTNALPRDLLMMSIYGRMGTIYLLDGTKIMSNATRMEISDVLDALGLTQGDMLYRGEEYWAVISAGEVGDILQLGAALKPEWVPNAGGGGGWWYDPPNAADFTLVSGDGNAMTLADDLDAGLLFDGGTPVAGDTKRFAYQAIANPSGDWDAILRIDATQSNVNYSDFGIMCQVTSNSHCLSVSQSGSGNVHAVYWPGLTGYTSSPYGYVAVHDTLWYRLKKTGTQLEGFSSNTGKNWTRLVNTTTFGTIGGTPDRVGFFAGYNRTSGGNIIGAVTHWDFNGA